MIGRVKDFLGIEGVRLDLEVHHEPRLRDGLLKGVVHLSSLRGKTVETLTLTLEERYERGRGEAKLIDSYVLGELTTDLPIEVAINEQVDLPFELPFTPRLSAVDELAERSILLRPVAALARYAGGAQSTYTLRGEASVRGTSLHPQTRLAVEFS